MKCITVYQESWFYKNIKRFKAKPIYSNGIVTLNRALSSSPKIIYFRVFPPRSRNPRIQYQIPIVTSCNQFFIKSPFIKSLSSID